MVVTFRFTLTDPIGNNKIISEPGGWDTASIGLIRHPQFLSLVEYFKSSFQTYGSNGSEDGGRDWILAVEKTYGPDALIGVLVEIDSNDTGIFRTAFKGNIGVGLFIETLDQDHLLQIVFANSDFWSKFIARYQTQVDIRSTTDLDGNTISPTPKLTLPLPSQKIIKKYSAYLQFNQAFQVIDITNVVFYIGFDNEGLKEITQQSSLKLNLINGADGSAPDATDPKSYNRVVPYFNLDDDGDFTIDKLQFTMSTLTQNDPNFAGGASFMRAKNGKNTKMTNVDFYIQQNTNAPILLTKAYRVVTNYVRNDGVTEDLYSGANNPYVTDYSLPGGEVLTIKRFDAIKLFGIYNDEFTFPFRQDNGTVYMWGTDGWNHDSGYDQMRGGLGSYSKWRGSGSIHDDSNQGDFAYGGLFAPVGSFPTTIDDDGGTGLAIKASQWWVIGASGQVAGSTHLVNKGQVIQAKVNSPTDSLADWYIWDKTPYEGLEAYGTGDGFDITFNTSAQDSTTEAFLTHDVAAGIIDRITGQTGLFYSEYLGNPWTSRVYGATGCGSLKANMLGLHVRGYDLPTKPMAPSMQDWFEGVTPIDCLGMGYEKMADVDVIRCERAVYFFDDSSMSILFSNVQTIKRSYDPNHQFNSIDYGYNKWQSQAASGVGSPSGIDDPQSQGTRNTLFKIIGKKFKIMSSWIGASRAIETMRRISILLSANYTYDNDIVVIKLHSNGDGTFRPELNENFSSITNLTNPDACYNVDLSSTRNFIRWLPYLSGCLQSYLSSFFKFATGQGNFTMTSTKTTACPGDETGVTIAENGDIAIGTDFLFLPMPFEIDHYMDFDDYETLVANKNKAIGISQTESGHKPFFIDDTSGLDYNIATGLVHLKAWPKEAFDIVVPETFSSIYGGTSTPSGGHYFEEPYFETEFE